MEFCWCKCLLKFIQSDDFRGFAKTINAFENKNGKYKSFFFFFFCLVLVWNSTSETFTNCRLNIWARNMMSSSSFTCFWLPKHYSQRKKKKKNWFSILEKTFIKTVNGIFLVNLTIVNLLLMSKGRKEIMIFNFYSGQHFHDFLVFRL